MHALEARRVDEDLEHRLRRGKARDLGRIELERHEAPVRAGCVGAPVIRARRGQNHRQILAKNAVLRKILDAVERLLDDARVLRGLGARTRALLRVEADLEQLDQHASELRMRGQRRLDESL